MLLKCSILKGAIHVELFWEQNWEEFQIKKLAVIVALSTIFGLQITCHFTGN